jgi:putative endopeptidase
MSLLATRRCCWLLTACVTVCLAPQAKAVKMSSGGAATASTQPVLTAHPSADHGPACIAFRQRVVDQSAVSQGRFAQDGLTTLQPLLNEIDATGKPGLPALTGRLQRLGVDALFTLREAPDLQPVQVVDIEPASLGLPDPASYTDSDAAAEKLRHQYVEHVTKMLSFAGDPPQLALFEARSLLAFELRLAELSASPAPEPADRQNPAARRHLQPLSAFEASIAPFDFDAFLSALHWPRPAEVNDAVPGYMQAVAALVRQTDDQTLHAYLRYHLLTAFARELPPPLQQENLNFYGHIASGKQPQRGRVCAPAVD